METPLPPSLTKLIRLAAARYFEPHCMTIPPPIDPIDFLLKRKFPPLVLAVLPASEVALVSSTRAKQRQLRETGKTSHRASLMALQRSELESLFKAEWNKAVEVL